MTETIYGCADVAQLLRVTRAGMAQLAAMAGQTAQRQRPRLGAFGAVEKLRNELGSS